MLLTAALGLALSSGAAASPLQCTLGALSRAERERQQVLIAKVRASAAEKRELPSGYSISVKAGSVSLPELAEWISLEARCCPFLDFALEVSAGGSPVRLRLTGPAGVKELLRAELSPER